MAGKLPLAGGDTVISTLVDLYLGGWAPGWTQDPSHSYGPFGWVLDGGSRISTVHSTVVATGIAQMVSAKRKIIARFPFLTQFPAALAAIRAISCADLPLSRM